MKAAIINCYYGKFPDYFQLWMESCRNMSHFDFFLFTDIEIDNKIIPQNVHVIIKNWEELLIKIQSKFDFKICIESPYKLTDFKVAYGYIFDEELKKYDYWGYCDVDMIFGDLERYLLPRFEENYEKIYRLGHLTLMKNNKKMRELFMQKGGGFSYKEVFSKKECYSFDEHVGLMSITLANGVNEYYIEEMADISCRVSRITVTRQKNYKYQLFYYEDGHVYRAYINENGSVKVDEFSYIHLQKRKMKTISDSKNFYILGSGFLKKKELGIPNRETIVSLSEYISSDIEEIEKRQYYKLKIVQFIKCSLKKKEIWIKQKKAERVFKE